MVDALPYSLGLERELKGYTTTLPSSSDSLDRKIATTAYLPVTKVSSSFFWKRVGDVMLGTASVKNKHPAGIIRAKL